MELSNLLTTWRGQPPVQNAKLVYNGETLSKDKRKWAESGENAAFIAASFNMSANSRAAATLLERAKKSPFKKYTHAYKQ